MTTKVRFLTAAQVQRLYAAAISSAAPTQPALLESAIQSPINTKYYENQSDVFQLAAILGEKIMKNHAYMDGNKRAAAVAVDMMLKINGYKLQDKALEDSSISKGIENAHVAVATGAWTASNLAAYYRSIATTAARG